MGAGTAGGWVIETGRGKHVHSSLQSLQEYPGGGVGSEGVLRLWAACFPPLETQDLGRSEETGNAKGIKEGPAY